MSRILQTCIFLMVVTSGRGQGHDNVWVGGYDAWAGQPWGEWTMSFTGGVMHLDTSHRPMNFGTTCATICDASGQLLFYTNGFQIADRTDSMMSNGAGLNPGGIFDDPEFGVNIPQSHIILPRPGSDSLYDVFHSNVDTIINYPEYTLNCRRLYRTVVDMSLNSGLGDVVSKNEIIFHGGLNTGLAAVRHANGRDWWLVAHEDLSSRLFSFLITPDSVVGPFSQYVGVMRNSIATTVFSRDGTRFAMMDGFSDLDLFDFDRCNGELTLRAHVSLVSQFFDGSAAFSPSGQFIYVSDVDRVFQYEVDAPNVAASQVTVAVWDSTYDPLGGPLAALFRICRLAPDDKIYISTGNGTRYFHRIEYPDEPGALCHFEQHGLTLPALTFNTMPYHPNYALGPLGGSPCDTLGMTILDRPPSEDVLLYPNPNDGVFTIILPRSQRAERLEIFDPNGRLVKKIDVPAQGGAVQVELRGQCAPGLYAYRLSREGSRIMGRFVID